MDQEVTAGEGGKMAQISADRPPRVPDAPGLTWRRTKRGWQARWRARPDLVARGFHPKSATIWEGGTPDSAEIERIQELCQAAQSEMLRWRLHQRS